MERRFGHVTQDLNDFGFDALVGLAVQARAAPDELTEQRVAHRQPGQAGDHHTQVVTTARPPLLALGLESLHETPHRRIAGGEIGEDAVERRAGKEGDELLFRQRGAKDVPGAL